ncbi:DUF5361 domain-containing protein [Streptococcus mitis]|uniref:DUF5361 domain-containing protein n=1 Tax=Streptococcus mitis TaxID=28037 RepID=UPI0021B686DB|nr:DUF5361 domain-containing protein [Streptococcus mitis]
MIDLDEDALICDLAETYQVYDYKQLPLSTVAVFAYGLKDDSRIKQLLSDQIAPVERLLLASMVDRLSMLLWIQSKDGQKGVNRPTSLTDFFIKKEKEDTREFMTFESPEDYEAYRKQLFSGNGGES